MKDMSERREIGRRNMKRFTKTDDQQTIVARLSHMIEPCPVNFLTLKRIKVLCICMHLMPISYLEETHQT